MEDGSQNLRISAPTIYSADANLETLDALGLAVTLVSTVLFGLALYEAVAVARTVGKFPRFWFFLLAAISFLVLRRILILASSALGVTMPDYWTTLDNDGTPIVFSTLLLIWIYDMRKSFERSSQSKPALVAPEQS